MFFLDSENRSPPLSMAKQRETLPRNAHAEINFLAVSNLGDLLRVPYRCPWGGEYCTPETHFRGRPPMSCCWIPLSPLKTGAPKGFPQKDSTSLSSPVDGQIQFDCPFGIVTCKGETCMHMHTLICTYGPAPNPPPPHPLHPPVAWLELI